MTTGHKITIEPTTARVSVHHKGSLLADTTQALALHETGCPTRYYIPPTDITFPLLTPSPTHTTCPFKGTASYWSTPDTPDLAWSYPDPLPEVAEIKGYLCFYDPEVS